MSSLAEFIGTVVIGLFCIGFIIGIIVGIGESFSNKTTIGEKPWKRPTLK